MNSKLYFGLAIIALVSIPLAQSLKCATCFSVEQCKKPIAVQCNAIEANKTRDELQNHYSNVNFLNTNNFSCFGSVHASTKTNVVDLRGCIMTGAVDCISTFFDTTQKQKSCTVCQKDMCNSVATISGSFLGIFALLIIGKMFVI